MAKMNFGIIVGNRSFFPDALAEEGRKNIIEVLRKNGFGTVALSMNDTKYGSVETYADAKKCAELFHAHAGKIDGIIVTLPNFGDEKGIVESVTRSGLDVPLLIQAEPDTAAKMSIKHRRDSFCGKISVCNNLNQAGIPYSLTGSHTISVKSNEFKKDLDNFATVCRIVKGLTNLRIGAIGARPAAFNTVRYSEKILQSYGISVEPVDLSEMLGRVSLMADKDRRVKTKLKAIQNYTDASSVPAEALLKMAKFGLAVDDWCRETEVNATTIQCWTSLETYFGITPCGLMSMMSNKLKPSACEVDVLGVLSMYVLQLAGGGPSAILDWNNNYGTDPDKCVMFHCSNLPKDFLQSSRMDYQKVVAGAVGKDNAYGVIMGRIAPHPFTFLRASTDDLEGIITSYVGEGEFTKDKLETFGGYGIARIPDLQALMEYVCKAGFEHHVAANICQKADALAEALGNYLGWEVYRHE
jgi:L-fucose isomerase-like protein